MVCNLILLDTLLLLLVKAKNLIAITSVTISMVKTVINLPMWN